MARQKKNKVFDLFKTNFKITFFYKPSMTEGDDFYYLVLNDVIRIKAKVIQGVVVIDDMVPVTSSYIKPIYQEVVSALMGQSEVTVLMSVTGNSNSVIQACVSSDAPLVEDERYITVAPGYYNKLKTVYGDDLTKYGLYVLAVGDEDEAGEQTSQSSTPVSASNATPIGVEPKISRVMKLLTKQLKPSFPRTKIVYDEGDMFTCALTEAETFVVEVGDKEIYIKDLLQYPGTTLNLIKLMDLTSALECLTTISDKVYILSVQNAEFNSICLNKGYEHVKEEQNLPINRLFRQAFHGYGTYRIPVRN